MLELLSEDNFQVTIKRSESSGEASNMMGNTSVCWRRASLIVLTNLYPRPGAKPLAAASSPSRMRRAQGGGGDEVADVTRALKPALRKSVVVVEEALTYERALTTEFSVLLGTCEPTVTIASPQPKKSNKNLHIRVGGWRSAPMTKH